MILALLYSLLVMFAFISFKLAISDVTINQKEDSKDLNHAFQSQIIFHSQGKHLTPRRTIEVNPSINQNINRSRRKRQLRNRVHQNLTLTNNITPMMDKDIKHSRRKRHSNNKNCHGLCRSSLCQWTESWDFDSGRNPAFIPKAKCTSQCNFDWATVVSPSIVNVYTACEPIKRDIQIFRNKEYTYIKNWPVACACTIKHISGLQRKQTKVRDITKYEKFKKKGQKRRWIKVKSKHKLSMSKYVEINKRLMKPFLFLPQFKK